jgi:hypothetical protein
VGRLTLKPSGLRIQVQSASVRPAHSGCSTSHYIAEGSDLDAQCNFSIVSELPSSSGRYLNPFFNPFRLHPINVLFSVYSIVTCRGRLLTGVGLVNGFTDHLYTRLGTTSNYSATANLHNSQITTASAKPLPPC